MSDDAHLPASPLTLGALADQLNELTIEMTVLRESIVTAAEWDNQARINRQQVLDATLANVRLWLRILVGVTIVLIGAIIWLLLRVGV